MIGFRGACASGALLVGLLAAGPALAQNNGVDHWYIQGGGGLNWALDLDWLATGAQITPTTATSSYDMGWLAGGAVGYEFASGFRAELEGMYRDNDLDGLTIGGGPVGGASGDVSVASIMFNVLYDIDTGSSLTPYIGAGIGAGLVDTSVSVPTLGTFSDDQWGLALQGIAGLSWAMNANWELFAQYHYFTVLDPGNAATILPPGGTAAPLSRTLTLDDDYVAHSAFFGARYHFMPPPPPPPPPPAVVPPPPPAAQDRFIVFFDWDQSVLTAQANSVLDTVVTTYNSAGFAQVLAEAHTDRSGSNAYNDGLSQRRGESVRQGLIARGIAPDEIVVRAFGETVNLVPTPDGVREPQNRRVEIILM